jgi:hypothetical protein
MSNDVNTAGSTEADKLQPLANSQEPRSNGAASSPSEIITSLTVDSLRELYQAAGYRVETLRDGDRVFLRSATNGLAFDIRPGNGIADPGRFGDIALVALLAVRGALPLDLLNRWNRTRRFGRLFLDQSVAGQEFLVLCSDVSVIGGVTTQQFRAQIDIWDSLIQQLIPWLREELGRIASAVDTAPTGVDAHQEPFDAPVSSPVNGQYADA